METQNTNTIHGSYATRHSCWAIIRKLESGRQWRAICAMHVCSPKAPLMSFLFKQKQQRPNWYKKLTRRSPLPPVLVYIMGIAIRKLNSN